MRILRITIFPDRPDTLLVLFPGGDTEPVDLPPLRTPFVKGEVAAACRAVGFEPRVTESAPGRWTRSMGKMAREQRAERGQRETLREATEAALYRGSIDPTVKERGEIVQRKHEVDARIRELKTEIAQAKSQAFTTGSYLRPDVFRRMEKRLEECKQESQALQNRLGELRAEEKAKNRETHGDGDNNLLFLKKFIALAKDSLDADTFEDLLSAAQDAVAGP